MKRIFNVLYMIGLLWMIIVGGLLFSTKSTFADGFFDGLITALSFSVGPLFLLFFVHWALEYIIAGKK